TPMSARASGALHPCNLETAGSDRMSGAVADGTPSRPGADQPVAQRGRSSAVRPSNPNSRRGRKASPFEQGRVPVDKIVVGIDVSKDRLDVHLLPAEQAWSVARDAPGLAELVARLQALQPALVGLEATGGFETVAVAALTAAGLPVVVANPAQIRAFAQALGRRAKTDPLDAAAIARFLQATDPEPRPLPDAAQRLLADVGPADGDGAPGQGRRRRPGARPAGQDRPARRRGHRPLPAGDRPRAASPAGCRPAPARRPGRPAPADRRDDRLREAAPEAPRRAARAALDRAPPSGPAEGARRARPRDRRPGAR